ncbi:MAG TPA: hypothetical protein ENI65_08965 [Gammaproteobacteria bacterium]|nr:hypothetical protein [Gammaproteobacteria bacterium]
MFYPCDHYGFSVPVVFRSKAQCEGRGHCMRRTLPWALTKRLNPQRSYGQGTGVDGVERGID